MTIPITPELRAAHEANRAAVEKSQMIGFIKQMRASFKDRWYGETLAEDGNCDFARISADMLNNEQRLALAIHLTDNLEGFDDDARNDAVDALGRLVWPSTSATRNLMTVGMRG